MTNNRQFSHSNNNNKASFSNQHTQKVLHSHYLWECNGRKEDLIHNVIAPSSGEAKIMHVFSLYCDIIQAYHIQTFFVSVLCTLLLHDK